MEVASAHELFTLSEGDIRDEVTLKSLLGDIEAIVHFAARAGVRPSIADPALYADVNLMDTTRLSALARERDIRSFVFASSSSVYGNNRKLPFSESDRVDHPISPYAATKKAGELLCHTATHVSGLTTLCLRLFNVYGPRQRPDLAIHKFAKMLRDGARIPMFGDGTTCRDYTFIDDIYDGVLSALDWTTTEPGRHEVINLGESRTITLRDMIDILAQEMNVSPVIEQLPPQPGDVHRTFADIEKARATLGYDPRTDFRAGIRRFLDWFEAQPRD